MSWIATIAPEKANGRLAELYQRIAGPKGAVDQVLQIHSLRPHPLEAHLALYKNVLHHRGNELPKWLLETVGIYVSWINGCDYCVAHHLAGLGRLLGDEARVAQIRTALEQEQFQEAFDARATAILRYASELTRTPASLTASSLAPLRAAGLTDGEILEVNQVASYFAYVNRTVLGLGVAAAGEILGLSPNDSENTENWQHS